MVAYHSSTTSPHARSEGWLHLSGIRNEGLHGSDGNVVRRPRLSILPGAIDDDSSVGLGKWWFDSPRKLVRKQETQEGGS